MTTKDLPNDYPKRLCQKCGAQLWPRMDKEGQIETRDAFNARFFCATACGLRAKRAVIERQKAVREARRVKGPRVAGGYLLHACVQCKEPLVPRTFPSGMVERSNCYNKRRFCGQECYFEYRRGKPWQSKLCAREMNQCLFCGAVCSDRRRRLVDFVVGRGPPIRLCGTCRIRLQKVLKRQQAALTEALAKQQPAGGASAEGA